MEKRAILAIVVTFLIIVGWSIIQSRFFPQAPTPVKEVKKEEIVPTASEKEKVAREMRPLKEGKPSNAFAKPKEAIRKEVSIETQDFWAVFTSEGASLTHFKLKKYQDRVKESPITIALIRAFDDLLGNKEGVVSEPKPLDLVNTKAADGLPLTLTSTDPNLSLSEGNWEVDKDQLRLLSIGEKGEIIFSKSLENGLKILKRYRFTSEQDSFDLEVEVQNESSKEITSQLGLEWIGKIELAKLAGGDKDFGIKYAFLKGQKVERKDLGGTGSSGCVPGCGTSKKSIEPFELSEKGDIRWFSFEGEYFTALLISPPSAKEVTLSVKGDDRNILRANLIPSSFAIPPQKTVKMPFRIYLGSRDQGSLKALGVEADKLIDFGYFTIVAKPLLWFLKLTNTFTKNFGIDIIILSILIKIIFLPLTQISMKSMKEMQKVQPEMSRLKETHKNDKARLQQEIMLLYKRRKINPMSGCLPMLIQIPVFIALYNALQNAIEMRHAPFFLWIRDLAAKDPIYITPIIMGASMVIQQKMTPTSADPAQAKMMLLMPVMFTFLFLNFPSGLVLYWLVNNVLSIAHQYYMNKKL